MWDELTLDAVVAAIAGVCADVELGGRAAGVTLDVGVGPFRYRVGGHAAVERIDPLRQLAVVIDVPALATWTGKSECR